MVHRASALLAASGVIAAAATTPRVAKAEAVALPTKPVVAAAPPRQYRYVRAIGLGSVLGFATGYALKKVARAFLLVLGLQFVFLQTLVALDVVAIKWDSIVARTEPVLSPDGQRRAESRLVTALTTNLPFKASFVASLYAGFKVA